MRPFILILSVLLCASVFSWEEKQPEKKDPAKNVEEKNVGTSVYDFKMNDIDGKADALAGHKGEVALIVNVASHCGFTPQYAGLEKLYEKYKGQGFTIIGVPANEFGKQEPGTNAQIKEFCSTKFAVTFPMLEKVVVKGEGICPLYKYLTTESPKKGEIKWNFNKFLVNRKGEVIERYDSNVTPEDKKLAADIEKLLAEKK